MKSSIYFCIFKKQSLKIKGLTYTQSVAFYHSSHSLSDLPSVRRPVFNQHCLGWWCLHPGAVLPGGVPRGNMEGGLGSLGLDGRGSRSPSLLTGSFYFPALCPPWLGDPIKSQYYVSFLHLMPENTAHELKNCVLVVPFWIHPCPLLCSLVEVKCSAPGDPSTSR